MTTFVYKKRDLFCENVKMVDIVKKYGTPTYVYSASALSIAYQKFCNAYQKCSHLICFSVKANSNIFVLKHLVDQGCGLDIVSGGELTRALKSGCPPQKIVFAGVGKKKDEIRDAISVGVKMLNVESVPELKRINSIALSLKKKVDVSLRVNPDVDPRTHRYITTGKKENKFGLSFEDVQDILRECSDWTGICIRGIHCHIGSQILIKNPFLEAIKNIAVFLKGVNREKYPFDILNFGGGIGIVYDQEQPQVIEKLAQELIPLFAEARFKEIIFEPGRFIAGNAGVLLTEVQYIKKIKEKNFVIVDAGMNDLMRPMLYNSYHEIRSIVKQESSVKADVVGPICESGDFFAKNRILPQVEESDVLAIMSAGAYCFTMSSHYNTRPGCAEVFVDKDHFRLIRRREKVEDLIAHEMEC